MNLVRFGLLGLVFVMLLAAPAIVVGAPSTGAHALAHAEHAVAEQPSAVAAVASRADCDHTDHERGGTCVSVCAASALPTSAVETRARRAGRYGWAITAPLIGGRSIGPGFEPPRRATFA